MVLSFLRIRSWVFIILVYSYRIQTGIRMNQYCFFIVFLFEFLSVVIKDILLAFFIVLHIFMFLFCRCLVFAKKLQEFDRINFEKVIHLEIFFYF